MSKTRACEAVRMSRSSWYRQPSQQEARDGPVIDALNAMIEKYPRWGFWMCYDRLRLDGHDWNHKRVYRVYKAMNLNLPRRKKRRLPQRVQQPMVVEARANAEWSLDFMSDALYQGRRFRTLNVLDEGVREALDIVIDTSIPGARVVRTLDRLVEWRGKPDAIRVDNGPEYISQVFALSKTRACEAVRMSRSSWYRQPSQQEARDGPVIDALNAMIEKYPRWGFWMCSCRRTTTGRRSTAA